MTNEKFSREKLMKLRLRQMEHLARQLEARETLVKSINQRRKWLERQKISNYQNEYIRIMGDLSRMNTVVPDQTVLRLEDRARRLHQLFSRGTVWCNYQ